MFYPFPHPLCASLIGEISVESERDVSAFDLKMKGQNNEMFQP